MDVSAILRSAAMALALAVGSVTAVHAATVDAGLTSLDRTVLGSVEPGRGQTTISFSLLNDTGATWSGLAVDLSSFNATGYTPGPTGSLAEIDRSNVAGVFTSLLSLSNISVASGETLSFSLQGTLVGSGTSAQIGADPVAAASLPEVPLPASAVALLSGLFACMAIGRRRRA